ncbi:MAG: putative permease [Verrucomicrobiales bacterium]|jgi:predicted permease
MLSDLASLFLTVFAPIVVVILIGVGIDRKFTLDLSTLVKINLYIFVPSFLFHRLLLADIPGGQQLLVVAFTLCSIAAMAVLSLTAAAVFRLKGQSSKALQLSTMFYNCGNWGIPMTALAFPDTGPAIQAFVLMTMNICVFTFGLLLASSHTDTPRKPGWWRPLLPMLRQPSLWAIAAALTIKGFEFETQIKSFVAIWKPLEFLAGGLVAMALLTLGVQLSQTKPPPVRGHMSLALVIRLICGPLVAALLAWAFGFEGTIAGVLILGAAAPTAVNTALLAHEFKADGKFAAAAVFYTTIFSAATATILLFILKRFYA